MCGICSIGFKERYHLKKHELFKHTTALNETCRICGKRFKDSTAVRAHERIHSDVRPYGCTLCGKTFKTSECLWHHENRSKTCGKMAAAAAAAARGKHHVLSGGALTVAAIPRQRQRRATVLGHDLSTRHAPPQVSVVAAVEQDVKPELADLPPPPLPSVADCDQVEADNTPSCAESTGVQQQQQQQEDIVVKEDEEVVVKTEPDCGDLFDVNLSTMMLDAAGDTSFVDFWQTFDQLDADDPVAAGSVTYSYNHFTTAGVRSIVTNVSVCLSVSSHTYLRNVRTSPRLDELFAQWMSERCMSCTILRLLCETFVKFEN